MPHAYFEMSENLHYEVAVMRFYPRLRKEGFASVTKQTRLPS